MKNHNASLHVPKPLQRIHVAAPLAAALEDASGARGNWKSYGPKAKEVLESSAPLNDGRFLLLLAADAGAVQDALSLIALKAGRK